MTETIMSSSIVSTSHAEAAVARRYTDVQATAIQGNKSVPENFLLYHPGEMTAAASPALRAALAEGDVAAAARLLGRYWQFAGRVVKGDQRGRHLGYPTANLATNSDFPLAQGVYAVCARLGDRLLDGVAAYGKPMFNNERPPFETHLFAFDEDIYGRTLTIMPVGYIRGQVIFSGLDELVAAIERDSRVAREMLAAMTERSMVAG